MRIITVNFNGIRSAHSKGIFEWLNKTKPDIVCAQEIKAQWADLIHPTTNLATWDGYHAHFHFAQKKGYSGVALYAKKPPDEIIHDIGVPEFDDEGRYLEARFGNLSIISCYFPSGSSSPERQAAKFRFLAHMAPHLHQLAHVDKREVLLCGDINIAHQPIDLKNWKGNLKNSGFLPEERAWLDQLFANGYVDVFRKLHPLTEQYTWWSNRGQAYSKNVGWRIDYQISTPNLANSIQSAWVYREQKFSDHAPLIMDYAWEL